MAFIWAVFILGTSTPCVVETTSSLAEGLGVSVPIPVFCWEKEITQPQRNVPAANENRMMFSMGMVFFMTRFLFSAC
jgi:hypothetical protein